MHQTSPNVSETMRDMLLQAKKVTIKTTGVVLFLIALIAGLWMLVCIFTLFSVYDYFRIGHFFVAGLVLCVTCQWLSDLSKWQQSKSED